MKVKCIGLYENITGETKPSSTSFKIGKIYTVLEVYTNSKGLVDFRIEDEDDWTSPIIVNERQFEIVDNKIPDNWRIYVDKKYGGIILSTETWLKPEFWEDFFNQEEYALEIYVKEKNKIYDLN